MINDTLTPAICKVTNYRDDLYQKFTKDVLKKEIANQEKKQGN
jgi:hypothetical protein